MEDSDDTRGLIDTTSPINTEIMEVESQASKDESSLNESLVLFFEVLVFLVVTSVLCVVIVSWHNGDTLLELFPFRKENVKKPVYIAVLCFLSAVLLVCAGDFFRRAYRYIKERRGNSDSSDGIDDHYTRNCQCQNVLPGFDLRRCLETLDFRSLAEIGLLATKGSIAEQRPHARLPDSDLEDYERFVNGIPFEEGVFKPSQHSVKLTVVIGGPEQTGKTSLYNQIVNSHPGASSEPCVGINCSLKTFTVTGPNMFHEDIQLHVEMQIWDISGSFTGSTSSLRFPDHVVFLAVCDVTNPESFDRVGWWIEKISKQSKHLNVALFLNKIDEAVDCSGEEIIGNHPDLGGLDMYRVSAKSGRGVRSSFLHAICKAVRLEARSMAE